MRLLPLILLPILFIACPEPEVGRTAVYDKSWPSGFERIPAEPFAAVIDERRGPRGPEIDLVVSNVTDRSWEMTRGCFVIVKAIAHRDSRPPKRNKLRRSLPPKNMRVLLHASPGYFRPFEPGETQRQGIGSFDPWIEIESAELRAPCH